MSLFWGGCLLLLLAPQAEAQAFSSLVREGLQPLLRVLRYGTSESEVAQTVSVSGG